MAAQLKMQKIIPHLWFDHEAEEAAEFYTSIFQDSRIVHVSRYGDEGSEIHGGTEGAVMNVTFELQGQTFIAINGGPSFTFNEAISFLVDCESQEEIDYYWDNLSVGGDKEAQRCGWLKDKYGLSWQINPRVLRELLSDPNPDKAQKVMRAMLQMKKIDIKALENAYDSETNR